MTSSTKTYKTTRFWSISSGISLLIMAIAAGFAYGVSFLQIYVAGNPGQTLTNIENNPDLYMSGAFLWCLILITDLIVSYGFYKYLEVFNRPWAIASGLLRLTYSIFLAVGIVFLFAKDPESFRHLWSLGLFIIGFHLIATGIGAYYSSEAHTILSVLLIIAGIGYSLINGLQNFVPQAYELSLIIENIMVIPMTTGELSFGIWLLVKGGKSINQQLSNAPGPTAP